MGGMGLLLWESCRSHAFQLGCFLDTTKRRRGSDIILWVLAKLALGFSPVIWTDCSKSHYTGPDTEIIKAKEGMSQRNSLLWAHCVVSSPLSSYGFIASTLAYIVQHVDNSTLNVLKISSYDWLWLFRKFKYIKEYLTLICYREMC